MDARRPAADPTVPAGPSISTVLRCACVVAMEVSGNVNQELLRIDDDNDEDDNTCVDHMHMGQLF